MKYLYLRLTKKQIELISWALDAAIEQHEKFLGGDQLKDLDESSAYYKSLIDFTEARDEFNKTAASAAAGLWKE